MRVCILVSAFGMLISAGLAQTPGFDPKDVVRQVRSAYSLPSAASSEPPALTGEFVIDTSSTLGPSPGAWPALAFDGENFLVVWVDSRGGSDDILGARVTPAGVVLDSIGIAISIATEDQNAPALAFDGTNFLVVWGDRRSDSDMDVYGARVSPAGQVLDPSGIAISTAASLQQLPALAFDGGNSLVVWQDDRDVTSDIYGARVTPAGAVLDPSGIPISTAAGRQWRPAIAFDGANSLVAWTDYRAGTYTDIYGARVTSAGAVLDTAGIPISTAANNQQYADLAFDGESYLAVWADHRGGSWSSDIYGTRLTPAGAVLDPEGILISAGTRTDVPFPTPAFDGENFLVVWGEVHTGSGYDIYGARVTPAGAVLDSSGIAISMATNSQNNPALAFDGENSLVVWGDARDGSYSYIHGARVTQAGMVPDTASIAISFAANSQLSPALAFDGANFLVAWEDGRGGSYCDIHGVRVTSTGAVLDPAGIAISTATNSQYNPAPAFDGANFLVVWEDYRSGVSYDVYGTRVTPTGVVLDPTGIAISTAANSQRSPALAFDGSNFLVVWSDDRDVASDIYGARVTPTGAVLDPAGIRISAAAQGGGSPALAFDGANLLVAWSYGDIYGARVTPAGVVLDTVGIVISAASGDQSYPTLSYDGVNFLTVWKDGRSVVNKIYGARVTPGGSVLDPSGIPISYVRYGERPALAFDGQDFLVAWQDRRGGSFDIYGARVTPDGSAFDSGPIVRQEGYQVRPALARGTDNQIFLVYQGWAGTVASKTYNTQRIWGNMDPNPAIVDMTKPEARITNRGATIVRRALFLPERTSPSCLLDISGRRVLDLHPGANDVRALAPGVYFVREGLGIRGEGLGRTQKVVVTE